MYPPFAPGRRGVGGEEATGISRIMLMAEGMRHQWMCCHPAFLHVANPMPDLQSNACESMSGVLHGIVFASPKPARRKCENPRRTQFRAKLQTCSRTRLIADQ